MAKIKKAQKGEQVTKPTYKNLRMGVNAQNSEGLGYVKERKPTKEDSAAYRFGYGRGLKGEKEYPGEPSVQKMGRWEGQNAVKKKKMKSGGTVSKAKAGKEMIKRADGSVSQRGLWDNIRENKGSGKKPTAQMLKQEKKIKAKSKK